MGNFAMHGARPWPERPVSEANKSGDEWPERPVSEANKSGNERPPA